MILVTVLLPELFYLLQESDAVLEQFFPLLRKIMHQEFSDICIACGMREPALYYVSHILKYDVVS